MVQHEKDYIMRQIQMLVQFVARFIFREAQNSHEIHTEQTSETGKLHTQLKDLMLANNICAAEDALHENFNESKDYLRLAMWFYSELNTMTDEELEASEFSREEVYDGLRDVLSRSGISLPG